MGGWNRSRHVRGHRDRRPWRPPLPPPDYENEHCLVPLWEREFCSYVGNISWQSFCQNKRYVEVCGNLGPWDDSGALENFENAKARFWAHYHGQPSDIPLPAPDMYIDKVDHHCKIDPELVADLDKVGLPFDSDYNSASATEADKKSSQNKCGNWDVYIEKPAEVDKWDWDANSRPDPTCGVKDEPSGNWGNSNSGWGDAVADPGWHSSSNNHCSSNNWNDYRGGSNNRYQDRDNMPPGNSNSGWGDAAADSGWHSSSYNHYSSNNWNDSRGGSNNRYQDRNNMSGNSNSGWGDAAADSGWRSSSNNHYSSNNWNDSHGGFSNRYQDRNNMSGRKRSTGGHFQPRNNRQRNQGEGYQRSGWHDHRGGRNSDWRPVNNRDRQNGQ
ncbi:hypothetical protein EJB05_50694 [Eragrostis curvula]|uniref:Uncharacterized protein n=1 Tax=Eragrostis curvula TaxID=38414 RepID=A0A5J9SXS5_9POAL|nr:hypothetical protein EJB05_50694 [Eragrostis curvula]